MAAVTGAFYLNLAAFHRGGGLAEIYMVSSLAWAGWAFVAGTMSPQRQGWLLALSGCLAGLAILCKPTALTTAAACMLVLVIAAMDRHRLADLWRQVSLYLAGLAAPLLAAGLVFLVQGSLRALFDASLLYNLSYVQHGATLKKLWTFHLQQNTFLLAGLRGGAGGWTAANDARRSSVAVA